MRRTDNERNTVGMVFVVVICVISENRFGNSDGMRAMLLEMASTLIGIWYVMSVTTDITYVVHSTVVELYTTTKKQSCGLVEISY